MIMSYLEFAYPQKGGNFNPTKNNNDLVPITTHSDIGGLHYQTWRNIIARQVLADKGNGFNIDNNPERIPGKVIDRYQDQNFIQTFQPLQVFRPATLEGGSKQITNANGTKTSITDPVKDGLKGLIKAALEKGLKVKAVGSGHSFSDIMTTPDFLVVTDDLKEMLTYVSPGKEEENKISKSINIRHYPNLNEAILKNGYSNFVGFQVDADHGADQEPALVEFEAGIKIRDLNDQLWSMGWSLYNMGTYQGQSFIGAASTSTHGSGNNLPPLPDMIKSMVIVADEGIAFRIEPSNGISSRKNLPIAHPSYFTDEAMGKIALKKSIFKSDEKGVDYLIQNDDCFNAALVNVGTFGIVYSVIIEVIPKFYLLETVELTTWNDLRKRLLDANKSKEIFEEKQYKAKFPAQSEFTTTLFFDGDPKCDDTRESHTFSKIRQVSILFNANKYMDENFCRIIRQYSISGDVAEKWVKKNDKGRLVPKSLMEFTLAAIDDLGEVLGDTESEQKKMYNRKQKTILAVIFQPVMGDAVATALNHVDAIANQIKKSNGTENYSPIEPNCNQYYLNRNYRVYVKSSDLPGYGTETAFSMEKEFRLDFPGKPLGDPTKAYITAVDHAIEMAAQHWSEGRYVQTGNAAIRFVKASNAYLSPQFGELTCMLEMLNVADTHGGKELFYRYQREFFKYGGRPHWGLDLSVTTGNNNLMEKMYPQFSKWKNVYDLLNFHGTFNNRFTDRMGLSVQPFALSK
jgi:hypothetical protein